MTTHDVPQELIDRIQATMEEALASENCRIEDIYASEQRELEEPVAQVNGNGGSPQWSTPVPTGVRRFSLYMRYTVLEEEEAYKAQREEK